MSQGYLRVQSFTSRLAAPVPGVAVTVVFEDGEAYRFVTDEEGRAPDLVVDAPDESYSLDEDNATVRPYAVLDLTAEKEGWQTLVLRGVQVFACQTTLADLELVPAEEGEARSLPEVVDVPAHKLFAGEGGSGPTPLTACPGRVLEAPIIPEKITVHLGRPAASAQNVTVSFRHYIANVASSEVYPTWPEQALRANIHAQISLALNRIFTEWYPSKGYSFNITNSTSYDQYFVYKRTIFEVMERLTDDIFNTYVRRTGTIEPYYTEYCDGRSVTCPGMKQWGTVTLAQQGRTALEILRYYYGSNIEIVRSNNIQSIPSSYPGSPLRVGSSGTSVAILQRQLNRIAKDYPFFGTTDIDGVYGASTAEIVRRFQRQFNLTADGVVGRATWYKISYIYVSVKDLAELTSEGETSLGGLSGGAWPGTVLRQGSTGAAVEQVQFWLSELSEFDDSLLDVTVDGVYGSGTAAAVRAFQRLAGLAADGVVGQITWETLYAAYRSLEEDITTGGVAAYPGTPLRRGDTGNNVRLIQFRLRIAATNYSALTAPAVDGVFGAGTEQAVRAFQSYFGLSSDGVVGQTTWNRLNEVYLEVANALLDPNQRPGTYPGVLRRGSTGRPVRELQFYLIFLSAYNSGIPTIALDGSFGTATENAVRAYQRLRNLTVDGVVGRATWDALVADFGRLRDSGPVTGTRLLPWPGTTLEEGDSGDNVLYVNRLLALIGFWYPTIPTEGVSAAFDPALTRSVEAFQQQFRLPVTGQVDEATWEALNAVYLGLMSGTISVPGEDAPYPGSALEEGSTGAAVRQVQQWLNQVSRAQCGMVDVTEDGIFGPATRAAVLTFQEAEGLTADGIVGRVTWDALSAAAAAVP